MDTLKKLLNATKEATLPDVLGTFRKLSKVLLLTSVGILTASPGWAVVLAPTSITVRVLGTAGGTDESTNTQEDGSIVTYTGNGGTSGTGSALTSSQTATTAFVDDIILNSITFGSGATATTINAATGLRPGLSNSRGSGAVVTAGRNLISATYGDSDTDTDGNPNPFVTSGNPTIAYTATPNQTPSVQDTAIQAAYSSLSLSQGISSPGQGGGAGLNDYTFKLLFENGIVDNSSAVDNIPELIIFERGTVGSTQSDYTVRAITGGTFANPTFSNGVQVLRGAQTPSGIFINTADSTAAEQINFAGIDLNDFGITANEVVYGIEFTSNNGSGADIFGLALTAASPTQLRAQALPEPLTIIGSGVALGFGLLMKREHSRKRQTES